MELRLAKGTFECMVIFTYTLSICAPTIRGTPCTLPPSPYVYTSTIDKQSLLSIFLLIHIHKDMKIKLSFPPTFKDRRVQAENY
jgi:hypothetical protein